MEELDEDDIVTVVVEVEGAAPETPIETDLVATILKSVYHWHVHLGIHQDGDHAFLGV